MAKLTPGEIADFKARLLGLVGNDSIQVAKDDEYAAALEAEVKGEALPKSTGTAYLLDLVKMVEADRAAPKKEAKPALKKLEEPAPVAEAPKVEEPVAPPPAPEPPKVEEVKVEEVKAEEPKKEEPKKAEKPAKAKKEDKSEKP